MLRIISALVWRNSWISKSVGQRTRSTWSLNWTISQERCECGISLKHHKHWKNYSQDQVADGQGGVVNGSENQSRLTELEKIMPPSNKKKKDARYFKTRFEVKKLNLDVAQLDPDSLEKRIELNHLDEYPATNHPAEDAVSAFKITEEHLKPVEMAKEREFWYVEDQSKLEDMRKIITSKTVIGVDVEVDSEYSYVPIITLIQISCDTHDFVIDATKLFPFITESLQSVFLDNKIVKLVFGQNDIREFKRDFSLYFVGVIDVQLAHQWISGGKHQTGLEKFVKIYLDKEIDKTNQDFHFKLRPLPDYILEYAKDDSKLLLECWEVMKERHRDYLLNQYSYKLINDIILKQFCFPKPKPVEKEFEKAVNQLAKAKRALFSKDRYFNVFNRISDWRKSSARKRDLPPDKVLSQEQVVRLCVVQPKSVHMLESVISELKNWKPEWKESLVKAIAES
ncbi:Exosome component 10 [Orchesella cincta]|uniref:Exosome component 10 n=1 Tax=Orchesella cincta TaxID=48709 RepID=A0A1D2MMF2_ORCCI|nr:Exosome component 10 [Orchesella cincta]